MRASGSSTGSLGLVPALENVGCYHLLNNYRLPRAGLTTVEICFAFSWGTFSPIPVPWITEER